MLDDVVRHIDALYELGAEDVAGFGSDFDGIEAWPEGLGDPSGFPALLDRLAFARLYAGAAGKTGRREPLARAQGGRSRAEGFLKAHQMHSLPK